ncbi:MAG: tRNA pseudouridine(55) synthase TruB [Lentilactobacillus hilgardii]|jgi:tRNA pseudouridine55 synthase|uniref:tRNA pseudouridine(55) synthase TruB n=1 Tax=Lentilactobacillus hilgardii TaxID=1588 RepID=UPI001CC21B30|nr:tRNA pseudouridine(55) synthase TruB [Lentilactobacillus hilgardii]MCI1922799.1 tRNA pseudouridine(55) synthase TruB [Lentilactobacillus buchneri]MBZ2201876.1 tRNA pseudouridine(55) synthase TruB [Lentilactobacillus hilgardii]MBZ2204876.1 tRNA pseudouridine(55) synthase TruB [Lentilactobacillus hilgardii]MCI1950409.1 tRNA pseudouridine(55) synthase TruB [Lentilactobacillus buchneri]MCI2018558.1 tRNA pseudouridine(55) synthase TruB [Lentilactobacillus buchneri]
MDGVIALYKERGMTSHDCISRLRKILHTKKIGHTGTLDPNVDGVLPICIGQATKISELLMGSGKVYRGSITLGMAYDTEDLDGHLIATKAIERPLSSEQIDGLLQKLTGHIMQVPPMYSAVKINGHKLYEYARRGEVIHREPRPIFIQSFKQTKVSSFDEKKQTQTIFFEVACSKGTYVRTLAVDFGKLINTPSVMSSLTRIKSGGFDISQCVTLEQVDKAAGSDTLSDIIEPLSTALSDYPAYQLDDSRWKIISNGGFLDQSILPDREPIVRLVYQGETKALYQFDEPKKVYRPFKMFLKNN